MEEACYVPGAVAEKGAKKFYALFWQTLGEWGSGRWQWWSSFLSREVDAKTAENDRISGSQKDRVLTRGPLGCTHMSCRTGSPVCTLRSTSRSWRRYPPRARS